MVQVLFFVFLSIAPLSLHGTCFIAGSDDSDFVRINVMGIFYQSAHFGVKIHS
jgi:hypothetical protein